MELQEKDNIYQNNIAILSMSRVDEDSGRTTVQFNPPSLAVNSRQTSNEEKKWYKLGFYNFVIAALAIVCVCVVLGVVITTMKTTKTHPKGVSSSLVSDIEFEGDGTDPITLNDVLVSNLSPELFNGTWISNNQIVFYDRNNNLCAFDVITRKKDIIISNETVLMRDINGDHLSKDMAFLLLPYDISKTFRHSTLSKYRIYDIFNDSLTELLPNDVHFGNGFVQYAEWGPKDTQIIFVHKNNIYYKPDVDSIPIQLTDTGVTNVVYNGYSDWVYEEEILEEEKAFWVSPEGTELVFAQINDTAVDTVTWPYYGEFYNSSTNQYPSQVALKYPKPGRHNPTVELFLLNLNDSVENMEVIRLIPPDPILQNEYYFTAVGWIDNNRFTITWLSRAQNFSVIDVCNRKHSWNCNSTFSLESANSWIDLYSAPVAAPKLNALFIKLPELITHEAGYYHHVAMINIHNKTMKYKYLTMGLYDVIEIMAFNQNDQILYFLSTIPEAPEVRHLMSVSIFDEKVLDPICLTCNLGNSCLYNNVFFSPDAEYYVLQCEGPKIPRVEIRRAKNNSLIVELEDNESLKTKLRDKALPKTRKLKIKTSDKFYAYVELVLPPHFDEKRKYPLMVEVYGGPGSQLVIDKYRLNHWGSHLASNMSIIYARIDGRGSDNKGSKYLHEIYKNLGNVEVMDIIIATRYIRDNMPFIEKNKIGIWGWSYGGYVTLMALALDYFDAVFQCGIAVSPVTNWMLYDSVYVERYMGRPYDNVMAYNRSDVLNKVLFLKEKRLLIAFGTADDNVHSHHSMLLMSKLNEIGMFYETQVYPDSDHSLRGSTIHLYQRMNDFLERCFDV